MPTETTVEQFDLQAWEAQKREGELDAFRADGFVTQDEAGNDVIDTAKIRARSAELVIEHARCDDEEARKTKPLAKDPFAKLLIPSAPLDPDVDDVLGREIAKMATQRCWSELDPGYNKPVQRLVGQHEDGLVLVKAKVALDWVAYVTANEDLIFFDVIQPLKEGVQRAAAKLAKNASMVAQRQPALKARVKREVTEAATDAGATVRNNLALESGKGGTP
jgi:hypothetical protein